MIHGLEDHDEACDYFDFIDNELQGATAEEMRRGLESDIDL